MRLRTATWPGAMVMATLVATSAAMAGDPVSGGILARQWCSECHLVEPGQTAASDEAPPFSAIADDPDTTQDGLETWLSDPHPPMPKLQISRPDINDLVAYILSLKNE